MKLSFVIPAYNEESYLPVCLEAVTKQAAAYPGEVEVIVVNNASTDGTKEVALAFPDVRVVDEPRKGLTFARQAGLNAASGELIAAIDSDSILPAGWLAFAQKQFAHDPKLLALSGPFIYYDLSIWDNLGVRWYYYFVYVLNRYVLRAGSLLQGGNMVIRRQALADIGGYNLDLHFYGEDADTTKRLNAIGRVRFRFSLPMYSSARRLKAEGSVTVALRYVANYLWILFYHQPKTETYIDIRTKKGARVTFRTTRERLDPLLKLTNAIIALVIIAVTWFF